MTILVLSVAACSASGQPDLERNSFGGQDPNQSNQGEPPDPGQEPATAASFNTYIVDDSTTPPAETQGTSGDAPLEVKFKSTTTGSIRGYRWVFGDGADHPQTFSEDKDAATDISDATHEYTVGGTTYQAYLEIYVRRAGETTNTTIKSAETPITVTTPSIQDPPEASFTYGPTAGTGQVLVNTPITFTNTSTGVATRWIWESTDTAFQGVDTRVGTEADSVTHTFGDYAKRA